MARIRTTKPEFWTSEQIVECSIEARLLFIGMWNFADDGGIIPHSNKSLKMKIYPADDYQSTDIQRMLDELSASNLIEFFEAECARYIRVRGWHHQKIDRPSFKYPQPCGEIPRDKEHYLKITSSSARRALAAGREGKGSILNTKQTNHAQARGGELARFGIDRFEPSPEDLDYCEGLELSDSLKFITCHFRLHHQEAMTVADAKHWSKLFRGWVQKNRLPQVSCD